MYKNCRFTEHVGRAADGANKVMDVNNTADCLEACRADEDNCMAVEFSEEFQCWMHTSDYTPVDKADITLYELMECSKYFVPKDLASYLALLTCQSEKLIT